MMAESSKSYKSYRTSAILFMISGILLIIIGLVGDKIYLLPIGLALVALSLGIWLKSRRIKENGQYYSSGGNQ